MAKIYIDTNRFIDFYREAIDDMAFLDDLATHKSNLVITRQTINEFRRNRVSTLRDLIAVFMKTVDVRAPHTTAILRSLQAHKELKSTADDYKKKARDVIRHLSEMVDDEKKDPVAQKLFTLWAEGSMITLEHSDELVDRAFRRKLLGTPPTSPGKFTVGDELIWVSLLATMKDDLVVVTGDRSFLEGQCLLQEEFASRTGKRLLLVTKSFGSALKAIGKAPSERLIQVEEQIAARRGLPAHLKWVTKGSGRHAAILGRKIDELVFGYAEEVASSAGEAISDQHLIPIIRLVASRMLSNCDEIESQIRDDFGEVEEGGETTDPPQT